jgi:hypothetical protein
MNLSPPRFDRARMRITERLPTNWECNCFLDFHIRPAPAQQNLFYFEIITSQGLYKPICRWWDQARHAKVVFSEEME